MHIAASANGAAKAGRDFVIAQIDVRAATRAIGRCRGVADFVFAFTFEAGDNAIALAAPYIFQLSMKRNFFRRSRFFFEFESGLRRGR